MIDEKKKLESMKASLEIMKKYTTDSNEKEVINELLNDDGEEVSDELMMKLVHQSYENLEKSPKKISKN